MARLFQRTFGGHPDESACSGAGRVGTAARMRGGVSEQGESRAGRRRQVADYGLDLLADAVETEIVPRLLLAQRAKAGEGIGASSAGMVPTEEDVQELARMLSAREDVFAQKFVEVLRARGISVESLFLHLFAPAARRLGEFWVEDTSSFAEVTLGLWRLHGMMHDLSPDFLGAGARRASSRRGLLVPYPGEQHCFGIFMVAEFFRRAGWDVWSGPPATVEDLVALVGEESFDVVGLSVASDRILDRVAATIRQLRRASCNPHLAVMVGGAAFQSNGADVAERIGADATASDGQKAVMQAESMLAMLRPGALPL
jgi:MerR family transcriptional regulator, light-induced transcriptional regulator